MSQDPADRPSRPFTLDDFRRQLILMRKAGVLDDPPPRPLPPGTEAPAEVEFRRTMAILDAMTPDERRTPSTIDAEARARIASASGFEPSDVSAVLEQFEEMARLVEVMNRTGLLGRARRITGSDRPPGSSASGRGRRSRDRNRDRDRPREAVRPRALRVDGPRLDPADREELLRRWEVLARAGRAPRGPSAPWFSRWDRGLRLWDFALDD